MGKSFKVLITCVGGFYGRDTIEALKSDKELDVTVVGVDSDETVPNRHFTDMFSVVPNAEARPEDFVETLLTLCSDSSIDAIVPGSDEEAYALSRAKLDFRKLGTECAVQDLETMELIRDKLVFFQKISNEAFKIPKFAGISVVEDLKAEASRLGYPSRRIILKPRVGRGARGLIVLDETARDPSRGTESRGYWLGDLESAVNMLEKKDRLLNLIGMEFLPGDIYDVDCLAKSGDPIYIVPRKRLWDTPFSRGIEGHVIEHDQEIVDITSRIVKALKLGYAFDCDFGTHEGGGVGILEVNPRWSGSVAASRASGVNIPALLVRDLMGLPLPDLEVVHGASIFPVSRMEFF